MDVGCRERGVFTTTFLRATCKSEYSAFSACLIKTDEAVYRGRPASEMSFKPKQS
jgi:hypothetical protein